MLKMNLIHGSIDDETRHQAIDAKAKRLAMNLARRFCTLR